jgi:hypothetical protein
MFSPSFVTQAASRVAICPSRTMSAFSRSSKAAARAMSRSSSARNLSARVATIAILGISHRPCKLNFFLTGSAP